MTVWAAPLQRYADATAAQLADRAAYARAVLGSETPGAALRPYDGRLPAPATPARE